MAFDPKLTRDCVKRLKAAQQDSDIESAHAEADQVLCDLLEAIGFKAIVREYHKVSKWYA